MYTALYRAQRPEVFSEIIGQGHIVRILTHQIQTGTVSHAYLFCGTRGTGKTTTARILAKAVNCLSEGEQPCGQCENCRAIKDGSFMDVMEIDAASNNGVDNIRELRESVKYPPAVGRKKVYIIDEVHMLSTGAFNALLKTLEEPPENVMFILATTDPQKLPQTILSRCMRLDFKRVPEKILMEHMRRICSEKGISVTDSALRLLAANADGSVRDGLSILDQCLSAGDTTLDRDTILEFLGTVSADFFVQLTDKVMLHDAAGALVLLDEVLQEGKDVKQLMKDWMAHYRNLLIAKYIRNPEDMLNMSTENIEKLQNQSNQVSLDEINSGIVTLSKTINDTRYSTQPRILLELAIVTIASGLGETQAAGTRSLPQAKATVRAARPVKAEEELSANHGSAQAPGRTPQKPLAQQRENGLRETTAEAAATQTETGGAAGGQIKEEYDLEEIWDRIFEEGEDMKGSFNLIRTGAVLAEIGQTQFKVIAHSDFTKQYVENNQSHICALMEKIIGRKLKLICKTEKQEENSEPDRAIEALAGEISSKLGIEVKIE